MNLTTVAQETRVSVMRALQSNSSLEPLILALGTVVCSLLFARHESYYRWKIKTGG